MLYNVTAKGDFCPCDNLTFLCSPTTAWSRKGWVEGFYRTENIELIKEQLKIIK